MILYMAIVVYAPALAIAQGNIRLSVDKLKHIIKATDHVTLLL